VTGFDGWLSSSQRRNRGDRTGRHGGFGSTGLRTAKEMRLRGTVTYASAATCAAERRTLLALGGSGLAVELEVTDALDTLTLSVGVDDADVKPLNDRTLSFEFTVTADDPFPKADAANTAVAIAASSTETVDNDGTAAADLLVTVTSPGTVILTAGGLTLTTTSLAAGTVIDTGACTVTSSGGADLFSSVVAGSQWPALPAGGGSVQQAGTAGLSVVSYDTYA
jgi:hypothetical protein